MAKNPRMANSKKTADVTGETSTLAIGTKPVKIYKNIEDFPKERREFVLKETVVHPKVQKRVAGVNAEIGAVPENVQDIFNKLDEGVLTVERLLRYYPIVIAGVKNDKGEVIQYARVDGHTRIPALINYLGNSAKVEVDYFECTERELYILSGSVNADNSEKLTRNEKIAMFTEYLNDKELVCLSDGALAELMMGQQEPRNIGNLRRSLIVKGTKELVRKGQRFEETLMTMIKKYSPRMRKGLDGREIDTYKITGDLFESMKADPTFEDILPKAEVEPAAEPQADQPAAKPKVEPAPAPAAPANFVKPVGELDEVSSPVDAADADGEPIAEEPAAEDEPSHYAPQFAAELSTSEFDADGYIATFDATEFATGNDNASVKITTDSGSVVISVAALQKFMADFAQRVNSTELFAIAE